MNNWQDMIFRLFVPMIFFAIWAITALFNRESKGFTPRPPGQGTSTGVRPGDPTLRWGQPNAQTTSSSRRPPANEDDILIISSDPNRPVRTTNPRSSQGTSRRVVKTRTVPPSKSPEPTAARPKLGGVSQNVNQQLARPMDLTPLTTIAPMATSSSSELANSPTAPSKTSAILTVSTLVPLMADPTRLREAFIVNELLQRPLALRDRKGSRP